ncbi:MAG TPA: PH domain-containing protein [Steroidobacteraceae bacterium]|jgi:hypothetical protein
MSKTYPSKVDWPILLPVLALPVIFVLTSMGASAAHSHGLAAALRVLFLLTIAFTLWTVVGTFYTLDDRTLYVRCGPFRWRIPLEEIRSVTATRDSRSGPALSFDRLCIEYAGGRRMLISPRDQQAFLRDLEQRRRTSP